MRMRLRVSAVRLAYVCSLPCEEKLQNLEKSLCSATLVSWNSCCIVGVLVAVIIIISAIIVCVFIVGLKPEF